MTTEVLTNRWTVTGTTAKHLFRGGSLLLFFFIAYFVQEHDLLPVLWWQHAIFWIWGISLVYILVYGSAFLAIRKRVDLVGLIVVSLITYALGPVGAIMRKMYLEDEQEKQSRS